MKETEFNAHNNEIEAMLNQWKRSNRDSIDIKSDTLVTCFEKLTLKEVKDWLSGGYGEEVPDYWDILYKDGKYVRLEPGELFSTAKKSGIKAVIVENDCTTVIYGDVKFSNYTTYEEHMDGYEDSWRADFMYD